ncbi:pentatricopeptide repeat-containing protein [Pyrus ussuriensis x Pyrus communis]|uniref:Pentatricopeptide repeat-containing protein n=1 Tax=Pyrus ussuriensis x Pyrus communis TaxID=2448454 RepID=A0A5N5HIJ1_9ROSA|nr:pentatricopeptide repeat-containing protein [Pyrus ussuriensis x Pyrus communis]
MVSGFAQHDRFEEALEYFTRLHGEDFVPNEYSFGSALSAYAGLRELKMGVQIHALIVKSSYSSDVYMGSALINIVFDGMNDRNTVYGNSLITCYQHNGPASEALEVFVQMIKCGFKPDELTLAIVQIHACVVKCDKYRNDLVLGNALVDMYAKCKSVKEARWIFDGMPVRNVVSETSMVSGYAKSVSIKAARLMFSRMMERNIVSWNTLIASYTQNREYKKALGLFLLLKMEYVLPTHYTFGNLLNDCADLVDLQLGRQVHVHVLKHGCQFKVGEEPDIFVENSLIDMYMKCGSVEDGSLKIFRKMLASDEQPNHVTMIGEKKYFYSMSEEYGLVPLKDHYTCMVDLLSQVGCLNDANNLIEGMPIEPDDYVAEKLLDIELKNFGPYVFLSNMYTELKRWADVVRQPGYRWIEIQGHVHVFLVKDKRHPQRKQIHYACDLESDEKHGESQLTSLYHIDMLEDAAVG